MDAEREGRGHFGTINSGHWVILPSPGIGHIYK